MGRRRIEMHHYRQALMRMRQGDSDRDIAKSGAPSNCPTCRNLAVTRGF